MSYMPNGDAAVNNILTLPAPAPRGSQSQQITTVARRALKDTAVMAARLLGTPRKVSSESVASKILDHIDELDGPALHALSVTFDALLGANGGKVVRS